MPHTSHSAPLALREEHTLIGLLRCSVCVLQGNFVALMGKVEVRVVGEVAAGMKLVPSGDFDGRARALDPMSTDGDNLSVLGIILQTECDVPGCVLAYVSRGLSTECSLDSIMQRIRRLERWLPPLERTLGQVLSLCESSAFSSSPLGAPSSELASWLARRMSCGRAERLAPSGLLVPIDTTTAKLPSEVVSVLLGRGQLTLAGTLLVLLGWSTQMDEEEDADGDPGVRAAANEGSEEERRQQAAVKIFEALGEGDNLGFQRKLFALMQQLGAWSRYEQMVELAQQGSHGPSGPNQTMHSGKASLCIPHTTQRTELITELPPLAIRVCFLGRSRSSLLLATRSRAQGEAGRCRADNWIPGSRGGARVSVRAR